MSARSQRGRTTPTTKKNSALPLIALGGVVVIAIAVILGLALSRQPTSSTSTAIDNAAASNLDVSTLGDFPSIGSDSAPVTVVQFADYQCPGCAAYATQLEPQIRQQYVNTGKVRFIYHELPIPSHANAYISAEAARAAGEQGKYWEMHDLLFKNQNEWSSLAKDQAIAKFGEYASQLGLDGNALTQVVTSGKYQATVEKAYQASMNAGVQYTPSFVINGKIYSQDQLITALDAALAK